MPEVSLTAHLLIAMGAMAAGALNALAGGGTLITFSLLSAAGVPPVLANATNTVALCVGPLGGAYAERNDFATPRIPHLGRAPRWWRRPVGSPAGCSSMAPARTPSGG